MSSPDNNTLIPVVSDLMIPGDPLLKKEAYEKLSAESAYADNLNLRINELEDAIGQNDSTSLSRAYAIREEASRKSSKTDYSKIESDDEQEEVKDDIP
ncbi:MAG: hypothetical protein KAG34_07845 [Cocleimonas sp.]|nr:hypothetical protein [Cocleimonas sp.]